MSKRFLFCGLPWGSSRDTVKQTLAGLGFVDTTEPGEIYRLSFEGTIGRLAVDLHVVVRPSPGVPSGAALRGVSARQTSNHDDPAACFRYMSGLLVEKYGEPDYVDQDISVWGQEDDGDDQIELENFGAISLTYSGASSANAKSVL